MNLPHPIQYQGSKRALAPIILKYFPSDIQTVIEPFAGTAAISIASSSKRLAEKYLINDLNKPLLELLKIIVYQPLEISDFYEKIWFEQIDDSIEHYYSIREQFNRTNDPKLLLYLLARCAKGSIRYNRDGYFNQSPDKRRKGTRPITMRKNIFGVSYLLKDKSEFMCIDYKESLNNINSRDLVYMDPPYQGVCGNRDSRYYSRIYYDEFVDFLDDLNKKNVSYIISYDGKTGDKTYGKSLPKSLNLTHFEIEVGRSTQATLLGRDFITHESLYLSQTVTKRLQTKIQDTNNYHVNQLTFLQSDSL